MLSRWVMLGRAFYTQDDYLMLARSVDRPITFSFLFQNYSGHLFPGGFLWAWMDARWARMDWERSVPPVVLMWGFACVLAWLVGTRLVGPTWARIVPMVVFCASPISLWSIQWWAVAIQFVPVTCAFLLAVLAHLRWGSDRPRLASACVGLAMLLALAFQERGLLVPVIVGALALALASGSPSERVRTVLRRNLPTWTLTATLGLAYLLIHRALAPIEPGDAPTSNLSLLGNVVFRNALPGLWGGPWVPRFLGHGVSVPPVLAVVLTNAATLALVAWSIRHRGRDATWAWIGFGLVLLANAVLLLGGRTQLGAIFGLIPRYAADLLVPATVLVALLLRPRATTAAPGTRAEQRTLRRPSPLPLLIATAYALSSAVTTAAVLPETLNRLDRSWVGKARAALQADPNVVLYDGAVPGAMMVVWFGDDARASTVLAAVPEHPVFDIPSSRPYRMIDSSGHVVDVTLVEPVKAVPVKRDVCGYHATQTPVRVPLESPVGGEARVLRLGYYSGGQGYATVTYAGRAQQVAVAEGAGSLDLAVSGAADGFDVRLEAASGTLCVVSAVVGLPYPARHS
ncbi:hypothetical protein [Nostocoides australiense]|nr:hypothetical protein [Tetrasphaera australiensis]